MTSQIQFRLVSDILDKLTSNDVLKNNIIDDIKKDLNKYNLIEKRYDINVINDYNFLFLKYITYFITNDIKSENYYKNFDMLISYNDVMLKIFDATYRLYIFDENSFLSPLDVIFLGGKDLSYFDIYFNKDYSIKLKEYFNNLIAPSYYKMISKENDKIYRLLLEDSNFSYSLQKRTINVEIINRITPKYIDKIIINIRRDKNEAIIINLIRHILEDALKEYFIDLLLSNNISAINPVMEREFLSFKLKNYIRYYFQFFIRGFDKKYDNLIKELNDSKVFNDAYKSLTNNSLITSIELIISEAREMLDYAKRNKIKRKNEFLNYIIFYSKLKEMIYGIKARFNKNYKVIKELVLDIEDYAKHIGISKNDLSELSNLGMINTNNKNNCAKNNLLMLIEKRYIIKTNDKLSVVNSF